jgi:hypothetical protein
LVSLACALHDEERGKEVKEALESGEAIIVYRLSGEIEKTTYQIEIFPNYKTLLRRVQGMGNARILRKQIEDSSLKAF